MTRLPAKPLIKLIAPALAVLLSACAVVDRAPAPKLEAGARWVVLPFANATETPFAGQRAEAISEGLLRTLGVADVQRYPAQLAIHAHLVAPLVHGARQRIAHALFTGPCQCLFLAFGVACVEQRLLLRRARVALDLAHAPRMQQGLCDAFGAVASHGGLGVVGKRQHGPFGIGLQGGGSATVYRRAGCQCAKHQGAGSNFQGVQDFGIAHHRACLSINIGWVQKCLR